MAEPVENQFSAERPSPHAWMRAFGCTQCGAKVAVIKCPVRVKGQLGKVDGCDATKTTPVHHHEICTEVEKCGWQRILRDV